MGAVFWSCLVFEPLYSFARSAKARSAKERSLEFGLRVGGLAKEKGPLSEM